MKKVLFFLSFFIGMHHSVIPVDQVDGTVVLRSLRYDLLGCSVMSAGLVGVSVWLMKKAHEHVRNGAKWSDPFDKKSKNQDSNKKTFLFGLLTAVLFTTGGTVLGYEWITNFLKRHLPLLIINEDGFSYETNRYLWNHIGDIKYEQYRNGDKIKTKLVFDMHEETNISNVAIKLEDIDIGSEQLTKLIKAYLGLHNAIKKGIHFAIKANDINQLTHLHDKIKNIEIVHWYDVLNVSEKAPKQEIKKAWAAWMRKVHSDKSKQESEEARIVNAAYKYAIEHQ